jgi:hypothetical protein
MRPWTADDDPATDQEPEPARPRSVPRAAAVALRGYFRGFGLFFALDIAVVLAILGVALAFAAFAPAIVLLPLVALPASALARAAVEAARGDSPTWAAALGEVRRRPARKLALAGAQVLVTAVGLLNLSMAAAVGGLPGAVIAAVGAYGLIVAWGYAVALWPIVTDPARDGPLRDQLRLALIVLVTRPLGIAAVVAIGAAAAAACVLLVVPMIVLPALVVLLCAAYVVPAADALAPADAT